MAENRSYEILFRNRSMKIIFLLLFAVIILFLLYIFRFYIWIFLYALIIYVALRPIHEWMLKYLKKRLLSSTLLVLILIAIAVIPTMLLLIQLSDQVYTLYNKFYISINYDQLKEMGNHPLVNKTLDFLNIEKAELSEKLTNYIRETSMSIFSSITSIVSFPINFIIKFFFTVLIVFFLFKDAYNFEGTVYRILPLPEELEVEIVDRLESVIYVLMLGNILIMFLQGLMVGIGLSLAGVSTPLIWGTLAAFLSLIPVIGTTLIWLPAAVYLYFTGNYGWAVFVAAWCFTSYMLLENLVKPKIFGDRLNFHPLVFFFLLLGSIEAFNIPGVIIGPIVLSLFYSFWEIYKVLDDYMENKRPLENRDAPSQP